MPNFFLLFSHTLTDEQIADARHTLGIREYISLPEELQARWSDVPPDAETFDEHLQPVFDWLSEHAQPGDYVLVQGDFGAVYLAVNFAQAHQLLPVYATTERKAEETRQPDGTVHTQRVFRHVRYRKYQNSRQDEQE